MEFFAHNGFYEEEQKIGNRYSVDVEIETDFQVASQNDDLEKTINYEIVYKIVKDEMNKNAKLLESIAFQINQQLKNKFSTINKLTTTVCKKNPPFGGLCEEVCVSDTL